MLEWMLLVKKVVTMMPTVKDHNHDYKDMPLSNALREVMQDTDMWLKTEMVVDLLKPFFTALTHMKGDEVTFHVFGHCFCSWHTMPVSWATSSKKRWMLTQMHWFAAFTL
jgi:hypothetical protein